MVGEIDYSSLCKSLRNLVEGRGAAEQGRVAFSVNFDLSCSDRRRRVGEVRKAMRNNYTPTAGGKRKRNSLKLPSVCVCVCASKVFFASTTHLFYYTRSTGVKTKRDYSTTTTTYEERTIIFHSPIISTIFGTRDKKRIRCIRECVNPPCIAAEKTEKKKRNGRRRKRENTTC